MDNPKRGTNRRARRERVLSPATQQILQSLQDGQPVIEPADVVSIFQQPPAQSGWALFGQITLGIGVAGYFYFWQRFSPDTLAKSIAFTALASEPNLTPIWKDFYRSMAEAESRKGSDRICEGIAKTLERYERRSR